HALAQTIERMLEAARHGYWQADEATVKELKDRYRELAQQYDVRTDNAKLEAFVGMDGFGLDAAAPAPAAQQAATVQQPAPPQAPQQQEVSEPQLENVTGMKLEQVQQEIVD